MGRCLPAGGGRAGSVRRGTARHLVRPPPDVFPSAPTARDRRVAIHRGLPFDFRSGLFGVSLWRISHRTGDAARANLHASSHCNPDGMDDSDAAATHVFPHTRTDLYPCPRSASGHRGAFLQHDHTGPAGPDRRTQIFHRNGIRPASQSQHHLAQSHQAHVCSFHSQPYDPRRAVDRAMVSERPAARQVPRNQTLGRPAERLWLFRLRVAAG